MTDFLSRLVERSAGRAEVARPVVPPLFAPGAPLGAEPVEEEALEGGGSGEGPERAVGASRPLPPVGVAPSSDDPSAAASPVEERRAEVSIPGRERPHAPAHRVSRDRLRVRLVRDAAPPLGRDGAALVAAPGSEPPRAAPSIGQEGVVELRPRDAPLLPRTVVRVEGSPAPPAPIVRISIGRVDVRAVPPARPAAPSPAPAPVRKDDHLSLEEYLRPRDRRR